MFNYKRTLQAMKRDRDSMQAEAEKLDQAIAALQALAGNSAPERTHVKFSASARQQISLAQKKRWAKVKRAEDVKARNSAKARPKISVQGLRNIVEGQRRRWAKVRASKTKA